MKWMQGEEEKSHASQLSMCCAAVVNGPNFVM